MPAAAVESAGLSKSFGAVVALDDVDLTVPVGSICALLGENGAGKTTLVRVLASILRPDAGSVRVLGHDVRTDSAQVRRRLGLTGQFATLDADLTARENLVLIARLLGYRASLARSRADELLGAFGLADAARRRVSTYSGGMRRRLDLAATVVVPPELLVLDEPTTGLDPRSRRMLWDIVRELASNGTTVLLTTQYLEEADRLADRIVFLDRGRVVASGTGEELKATFGSRALRIRLLDARRRDDASRVLAGALAAEVRPDADPAALTVLPGTRRHADDTGREMAAALRALLSAGIESVELTVARPSLDDVFLALTEGRRPGPGRPEPGPTKGPAARNEEVPR
jgi:ABC-2 type transport system ATP-binding protein